MSKTTTPPPKLDTSNLHALATHLLTHGPHKTLPSHRRVRALFAGTFIADSTSAPFVWEHAYFPQYYVPRADTSKELEWSTLEEVTEGGNTARICKVSINGRSTERVLVFEGGVLGGLVRFENGAMDSWLEEDVPTTYHPKDPFKRVDLLPSTRPIRVFLDGELLASSPFSVHLHETGLPVRYYLPYGNCEIQKFAKSEKTTGCPYKGTANYWDVKTEKGVREGLVWYYVTPTLECAGIAGLCCFYNEKVDIELDGVMLDRPKSVFG